MWCSSFYILKSFFFERPACWSNVGSVELFTVKLMHSTFLRRFNFIPFVYIYEIHYVVTNFISYSFILFSNKFAILLEITPWYVRHMYLLFLLVLCWCKFLFCLCFLFRGLFTSFVSYLLLTVIWSIVITSYWDNCIWAWEDIKWQEKIIHGKTKEDRTRQE